MGKKDRKIEKKPQVKTKTHSKKLFAIALAVLTGLTFIVFTPILSNEFINLDDPKFIYQNNLIQSVSAENIKNIFETQLYTPHYKPLVYLSWAIEYQLFGMDVTVFHFNNLLLHLVNTLLVFFIFLHLFRILKLDEKQTVYGAFFTAALFGIHPLHVESVAWATERKDVLFSLFYLGSIYAYLKYLKSNKSSLFLIVSIVLFILSLLSKSMGITLPVALLLVDYLTGRKINLKNQKDKIPYLIIGIIILFIYGILPDLGHTKGLTRGIVESGSGVAAQQLSLFEAIVNRITMASFRVSLFLIHLIIPVKLSIFYPVPEGMIGFPKIQFFIFPITTAITFYLLFHWRKKQKQIVFGILFFSLTIVPALIMSESGTNFLSDRYTYIPSIGIFFLIIYYILKLVEQKKLKQQWAYGFLIGALLIFSIQSFARNQIWKNSETLFSDVIKKYPKMVIAHNNRGNYYAQQDNYKAALVDYNNAIQINPNYLKSYINRGNVHALNNQHQKALEDYNKALTLGPKNPEALKNRAITYSVLKDYKSALKDFEALSKNAVIDPSIYLHRGYTYMEMNELNLSIQDYTTYISFIQDNFEAYSFRGKAFYSINDFEAAISDFSKAIKLNPNHKNSYYDRTLAYYRTNRFKEALSDATKARQLGYPVPQNLMDVLMKNK